MSKARPQHLRIRFFVWARGLVWIGHRPSKPVIAGSNPAASVSTTTIILNVIIVIEKSVISVKDNFIYLILHNICYILLQLGEDRVGGNK